MLKNLTPKQKMLLTLVGVVLLCTFVLGGSLLSLVHNKLELHRLSRKKTELEQQYITLQQHLEELQNQDPAVLERLARQEYNMVNPGEIEFRFEKND